MIKDRVTLADMENIKINQLSFSYEDNGKLILKDINIEVQAGEFVCILGQSGCGKSTLLRLLAGLLKPTSGELLIGGKRWKEPVWSAALYSRITVCSRG